MALNTLCPECGGAGPASTSAMGPHSSHRRPPQRPSRRPAHGAGTPPQPAAVAAATAPERPCPGAVAADAADPDRPSALRACAARGVHLAVRETVPPGAAGRPAGTVPHPVAVESVWNV